MSPALAVYGTLAPGEPNHYVVRSIPGEWVPGEINGYRFEITWGPASGYPGFVLGSDGPAVAVQVLRSEVLDKHWRTIDEFEGAGYERVLATARLVDGEQVEVWIYQALTDVPD